MKDRKNGCLIAALIGVLFPLLFFYVFKHLDNNREVLTPENCLPIYGNKQFDGKDTIYHTIPAFSFLNQNGDTISDSIMYDKVIVADFFFTTCPSICIDMAKNLRKIQHHFFNEKDVRILSFTVDPETDSVPQLQKYAVENEVNSKIWHLLTGNKKELYDLARNSFLVTALKGDGGPNDFIHSEKLILIDKERRIRGYYNGTDEASVDQMRIDIQRLLVSYIMPENNEQ